MAPSQWIVAVASLFVVPLLPLDPEADWIVAVKEMSRHVGWGFVRDKLISAMAT